MSNIEAKQSKVNDYDVTLMNLQSAIDSLREVIRWDGAICKMYTISEERIKNAIDLISEEYVRVDTYRGKEQVAIMEAKANVSI